MISLEVIRSSFSTADLKSWLCLISLITFIDNVEFKRSFISVNFLNATEDAQQTGIKTAPIKPLETKNER